MVFYTFHVLGPPVPKARARSGRGHHYTPARTREQEERIRAAARKVRVMPIDGPVFLSVIAYRANRRRMDWDNIGKLVSDALNGIAYEDDDQVACSYVAKRYDPECPRTVISVWALNPVEVDAQTHWLDPRPT